MSTCLTQNELQPVTRKQSEQVLYPHTDSYRTEAGLVLKMDLPGASKENLDLQLEDRILKVVAPRSLPTVEGESRLLYAEIHDGRYERSFQLPETVDLERVEASYDHGVLEIRLPEMEETRSRKVTVNIQ